MPEGIRACVCIICRKLSSLFGFMWDYNFGSAVPLSGGHFPVTSVNHEDTDPSNNRTCIPGMTNSGSSGRGEREKLVIAQSDLSLSGLVKHISVHCERAWDSVWLTLLIIIIIMHVCYAPFSKTYFESCAYHLSMNLTPCTFSASLAFSTLLVLWLLLGGVKETRVCITAGDETAWEQQQSGRSSKID